MNKPLLITIGTSTLMLTGCITKNGEPVNPNIVFILADDLGYGDIRYLNIDSKIPTPNIDRLCNEGMSFTDAHSGSAVSTPTRYGILTGRYCFRSRLKQGVLNGYDKPLIESDRPTIASMLKEKNYHTACVGKWHLGLGWQAVNDSLPIESGNVDFRQKVDYSPNEIGFDYSYIIPASFDMAPYVYLENGSVVDPQIIHIEGANTPRGNFWREGEASQSFSIDGCLDHLFEKAKQFIVGCQTEKQPFFLYFPLTAPHTPWLPAERFNGISGAGKYGDFVAHVDFVVGQILNTLDSLGLNDNTMIVFTSDNGADWKPSDKAQYPHLANYIFRGQKSDAWDGGHHIPCIIRYPGITSPCSSSDALICLTDFFATCAEITGANLPKTAEDSKSFFGALQGSGKARDEIIHHSINGRFAIRNGEWKLVDCSGSGGWSANDDPALPPVQLYNMKDDPGESINLYEQFPEKVEELKKCLESVIH